MHLAWGSWRILNKENHRTQAEAGTLQQSDPHGLQKAIFTRSFAWDKASGAKQSRGQMPPEMSSQALAAQASGSNVGAFGCGCWDRAGCHP